MIDDSIDFETRAQDLRRRQEQLLATENRPTATHNGIFQRWQHAVVTAEHTPLTWRYDFNPETNPFLMERQGINSTCNAGAIYWQGKYALVVRVEGHDRKSFLAVADSPTGVDRFRFWDYPITMPETDLPDTNVYDMRLTRHEDGCVYGLFCTERRDPGHPEDHSAAIAQCGIARTSDLVHWERLPDLITNSSQQRNVVLHPEFIEGQYAFYTRPQDGFVDVGTGGGIGWGLTGSMEQAEIKDEVIIDAKQYHTIKELKNGQGPPPIKTDQGWLHLAHGVRGTAAGLRYVLYLFLTKRDRPWEVTHMPAGYLLAPQDAERVGDVSNVVFCNGWIENDQGQVFIYYASADTRMHVATTTKARLLDYVQNTPGDGLRSAASVAVRRQLIEGNRRFLKTH